MIASGFEFPIVTLTPSIQAGCNSELSRDVVKVQASTGGNQTSGLGQTAARLPLDEFKGDKERTVGHSVKPVHAGLGEMPLGREEPQVESDAASSSIDPSQEQNSALVAGNSNQIIDSQLPDQVTAQPSQLTTISRIDESFRVSRVLMARYDRAQLYEKVWSMPAYRVAEAYEINEGTIWQICRKLHIPTPPRGYWQKKAANKVVDPQPPLPTVRLGPAGMPSVDSGPASEVECPGVFGGGDSVAFSPIADGNSELSPETVDSVPLIGSIGSGKLETGLSPAVEPTAGIDAGELAPEAELRHSVLWETNDVALGIDTAPDVQCRMHGVVSDTICAAPQGSITVPASLMSRYDRQQLFEEAWTLPMSTLAKKYRVTGTALAKTCRKLHIPFPSRGYWAKIAANKPVVTRPPLPIVQSSQKPQPRLGFRKHLTDEVAILLQQIDVSTSNGKTLLLACQEAGISAGTYHRWRKNERSTH